MRGPQKVLGHLLRDNFTVGIKYEMRYLANQIS